MNRGGRLNHFRDHHTRDIGVSAFPALALAIALTYVLGDFFRPFLPRPLGWILDIALCFVIYKISYYYLSKLRE
jgi:hypothetical protein